jgi:predicted Zn-dependent protease
MVSIARRWLSLVSRGNRRGERVPSFLSILSVLAAASCASSNAPSTPPEPKFLRFSKHEVARLEREGQVLSAPKLEEYLSGVKDKLVDPSLRDRLRVRVLRDPSLNAVAYPTGDIFINTGLLARLRNEGELAFIMAHECNHVLLEHAAEGQKTSDVLGAAASTLGIAAGVAAQVFIGTTASYDLAHGIVAQTGKSVGLVYSRSQETEADEHGLAMLVSAQYSPRAALDALRILGQGGSGPQKIDYYLSASHPGIEERLANVTRLLEETDARIVSQDVGESEVFRGAVAPAVTENIRLQLIFRRYQAALAEIKQAVAEQGETVQLVAWEGDAHRLAAVDPVGAAFEVGLVEATAIDDMRSRADAELALAERAYSHAINTDPQYAEAYRGMFLVTAARNDRAGAEGWLQRYFELNPEARDRRFLNSVLERMSDAP